MSIRPVGLVISVASISVASNVLRKRKMEITDFVDTEEESSREDIDNEGTDDKNQ